MFTIKTKIISPNQIDEAVTAIKKGELVAFPTETVYGLGADATNELAVRHVYLAKGRPSDNPLIIHVATVAQIERFVEVIPEKALKLIDYFWPGPLTLILPLKKSTDLSKSVTGGLKTGAFRMPSNQLTLDLIKLSQKVLVGPSANTSGSPSPTKAQHVMNDLSGKIFGVLDGGACEVGLESTVLDISSESKTPIILRPGVVTKKQIESVIGPIEIDKEEFKGNEQPKAPGMKYKHYSPNTQVVMIDYKKDNWQNAINAYKEKHKRVGILVNQKKLNDLINYDASFALGKKRDVYEAMFFLFDGLRELDQTKIPLDIILVETFEQKDEGIAFMNRLNKASNKNIFND